MTENIRPRLSLGLLAAILLAITSGIAFWQNAIPHGHAITAEEADRYMSQVRQLPLPAMLKTELNTSLAAFMAEDDGKPIYMLNLMRFYKQLKPYAGSEQFKSPQEANACYESEAMLPLTLVGGQPIYMGNIHSPNILSQAQALNHWDRLLLVRYPNRRAFVELVTNPAYATIAPFKIMSLELILAPSAAELLLPPYWACFGALSVIFFLLVAWRRERQGRGAA